MRSSWTRRPVGAALGLALGGILFLASGCGGNSGESDEATVQPDPTAPAAAPTTTPAPTPAPAAETKPEPTPAGSPAPSAAAAPTEAAKPGGWGTLKGQITFAGEPPALKPLVEQGKAPVSSDICAKDAPIPSERLVVDAGTKGVKNVLVYIPKPTEVNAEAKSAAAQAEVEFDQQKCVFKPHVLAVMAGAKILLKNSDETNHNVESKLRNNPMNPNLSPFKTEVYPTEKSERAPGEVVCNIHPWMKAYWLITDSPYFAVTDAKGNFEIKDVPSGIQKVVVWQEAVTGGGYVTPAAGVEVSIQAGESNAVNLAIDPGKIIAP